MNLYHLSGKLCISVDKNVSGFDPMTVLRNFFYYFVFIGIIDQIKNEGLNMTGLKNMP